jgi:transcription elongation factor GreA
MPVPMTVRGEALLRAELHQLKTVERPTIVQAIAEARAQGDISENAEYDSAKEKQGFIEGRIQDLDGKLSNAQIIDPQTIGGDGKVVFGCTVQVEDLNSGVKSTYTLVGEDEANFKQGLLSYLSPIARALIAKFEGDVASVDTPNGKKELEILAVSYT